MVRLWQILIGLSQTFGVPFVVITGSVFGIWLSSYKTMSAPQLEATRQDEPKKEEKVSRIGADRLVVAGSTATKMGLKSELVKRPIQPLALPPFQGNLALNSNEMQRVHSRFAGEVISLGVHTEKAVHSTATTESKPEMIRPLRVGDKVTKGQLLAVVWSKDLGEKKSELIDAASKMKLDLRVHQRLKDLYKQSGTSERAVLDAERAVESDRVAMERAERTLRSWRLTDAEIQEIIGEADKLSDLAVRKVNTEDWARVEVRASHDGTILEKSIKEGEIVDTTTDLFKIGDLTHLSVWAHVYEDDLPLFADLNKPVKWVVSLPSRPGVAYKGILEQIGAIIDPNQHTALITGRVENPNGDLKIGQFVTVAIDRIAGEKDLVVPSDAVVEDGRESIVFVQPEGKNTEFVCRKISVVRRTRDLIFLHESPEGLHPGDRVVTSGSLLLHDAMAALAVPSCQPTR